MVKPNSSRPANAPISDTGTAMIGISVARQLCRNTNTTSSTRNAAAPSVMHHLVDRRLHEARRIEGDALRDALREAVRQFTDSGAHGVRDLERVGAGLQKHRNAHGRLAIEVGERVVANRAELDARDVAYAQRTAGSVGAQHDIAEVGRVLEPPACVHRVSQRLPRRRRLGADPAGGVLIVLRLDRLRHVGGGHPELRHSGWIEPDAHRVVARAEDGHVGDAGNALELV